MIVRRASSRASSRDAHHHARCINIIVSRNAHDCRHYNAMRTSRHHHARCIIIICHMTRIITRRASSPIIHNFRSSALVGRAEKSVGDFELHEFPGSAGSFETPPPVRSTETMRMDIHECLDIWGVEYTLAVIGTGGPGSGPYGRGCLISTPRLSRWMSPDLIGPG
eukprot:1177923-Prorocentrum_minimum.AAC.3